MSSINMQDLIHKRSALGKYSMNTHHEIDMNHYKEATVPTFKKKKPGMRTSNDLK